MDKSVLKTESIAILASDAPEAAAAAQRLRADYGADAETIMIALEGEIALAAATTATDVESIVASWFAPGGGFDTLGYLGGPAMATGTRLSDSETAPPHVTA